MKKLLALALLLALPSFAQAGETADLLAKQVRFPVPADLCAMPESEHGKLIFARLDQVQRDIGNRLIAIFPNCEDAARIEANEQPLFAHYAALATHGQVIMQNARASRAEVITETTAEFIKGNPTANALDLLKNAEGTLSQLGVQDISLTQPVSFLGQDELAAYALMRQRVTADDKTSGEIMGALAITAFNDVPVFVYFYDAPPTKGSAVRLYQENKAYLAQLESLNAKP